MTKHTKYSLKSKQTISVDIFKRLEYFLSHIALFPASDGTEKRHLLDLTFRISKQPLVDPAGLLIMDSRLNNTVAFRIKQNPVSSGCFPANQLNAGNGTTLDDFFTNTDGIDKSQRPASHTFDSLRQPRVKTHGDAWYRVKFAFRTDTTGCVLVQRAGPQPRDTGDTDQALNGSSSPPPPARGATAGA